MKAILVIDMPEDFDYGRCSMGGDGNIYYERDGEQRTSIIGNIKNLKPMPEKLSMDGFTFLTTFAEEKERAYANGWNACLDEITGETDETD